MGGLMDIKNAMMGPLGLILLFQGAIAMLERWSMTAEKATDVTKDLNDAFSFGPKNDKEAKAFAQFFESTSDIAEFTQTWTRVKINDFN